MPRPGCLHDSHISAEVIGILSQTLGSGSEFNRLLEEIRSLREDFGRRFEASDRRFEALREDMERRFEALREEMDRRFEAVERTLLAHTEEHRKMLRRLDVELGSLGRRMGTGFEESVRAVIEEFSGVGPLRAERLVIRDAEGEQFDVRGQSVEFDSAGRLGL